MEFYVNEDYTDNKATVHRGTCRYARVRQKLPARGQWHGPFSTPETAETARPPSRRGGSGSGTARPAGPEFICGSPPTQGRASQKGVNRSGAPHYLRKELIMPEIWVISPHDFKPRTEFYRAWAWQRDNGVIAIGWDMGEDVSSLSREELGKKFRERMKCYPKWKAN